MFQIGAVSLCGMSALGNGKSRVMSWVGRPEHRGLAMTATRFVDPSCCHEDADARHGSPATVGFGSLLTGTRSARATR